MSEHSEETFDPIKTLTPVNKAVVWNIKFWRPLVETKLAVRFDISLRFAVILIFDMITILDVPPGHQSTLALSLEQPLRLTTHFQAPNSSFCLRVVQPWWDGSEICPPG